VARLPNLDEAISVAMEGQTELKEEEAKEAE
jgi:hypothetical protein